MQLYCLRDKEYNDLPNFFFNTQVKYISRISVWQCLMSVFVVAILYITRFALRNLFSAKTFNEYSAKSLITFLVPFSSVCIYNILPCFVAHYLVMLAIKSTFCLL
jgi:hypothetical protein